METLEALKVELEHEKECLQKELKTEEEYENKPTCSATAPLSMVSVTVRGKHNVLKDLKRIETMLFVLEQLNGLKTESVVAQQEMKQMKTNLNGVIKALGYSLIGPEQSLYINPRG
jgi:hypothetical protein